MIKWTPRLAPVFPSVVERVCAKPVPDLKQTPVYHGVEHEGLASSYPEATAKLLVHLLAAARDPFYHCYEAIKIAEQLARTANPPSQLTVICDQLLGLGCSEASGIQQRLTRT